MKLIELTIERLFIDLSGENWVLILSGEGKNLAMSVGLLEGAAIDAALNQTKSPRPLTADTALISIRKLGGEINRVIIRDFKDGTYFATIELRDAAGILHEIDSRPSDAIALALRAKAGIFTVEGVLREFEKQEEEEKLTAKALGISGEKIGEA